MLHILAGQRRPVFRRLYLAVLGETHLKIHSSRWLSRRFDFLVDLETHILRGGLGQVHLEQGLQDLA